MLFAKLFLGHSLPGISSGYLVTSQWLQHCQSSHLTLEIICRSAFSKMSNYSFDLLTRIGLTGFSSNINHHFFRWVVERFSTKGCLVFKSPVRCFSPCCCRLTSDWGLRWTRCWTWSWSSRKSITELWISTDWQDTSSTPWLLYVHRSATQRSEHWRSSRTLWSSWGEEQLENIFTDRAWTKKQPT